MSPSAVRALWAKLETAGLTIGKMPAAATADTPWYVRVMLGIAGLIAAGFLLGFVGMGFAFVMQSNTAALVVGLLVIAAAYVVFRAAPHNDFTAMFALAVSIAGQVLVTMGLFGVLGPQLTSGLPWAALAVLEAGLAAVMPNFLHRLGSACAAGLAFASACGVFGAPYLAPGVLAIVVAAVWLNETRWGRFHAVVTPIGYGLTLAFTQNEGMTHVGHSMVRMLGVTGGLVWPWIGEALVVTALLGSVGVLLKRAGWGLGEPRALLALGATAALGAASFKASGIAGGLMIALLGFAIGEVVLVGLGILALLVYVFSYYYLLDATLLLKSGVLLATGVVLLATRWLMLTVVLPTQGRRA